MGVKVDGRGGGKGWWRLLARSHAATVINKADHLTELSGHNGTVHLSQDSCEYITPL